MFNIGLFLGDSPLLTDAVTLRSLEELSGLCETCSKMKSIINKFSIIGFLPNVSILNYVNIVSIQKNGKPIRKFLMQNSKLKFM